MEQNFYEHHTYIEQDLPVIFTKNKISYKRMRFHWHENLEIVHCIDGQANVVTDGQDCPIVASDIAIINSNSLHDVQVKEGTFQYELLIIDKSFCDSFGFSIEEIAFQKKITDLFIESCLKTIENELRKKQTFYKEAVKLEVLKLLLYLVRNYQKAKSIPTKNDTKIEMVKKSIKYIKTHFTEHLTLEELAKHAGFSKFYFCRAFKDVTGYTVNSYINFLRANYAYSLISERKHTITEIALLSGFESSSYFTKNFKKHMGTLPSQVNKRS